LKLLICFLYEGEYEPKLPVISREEQVGIWTVTVPKDEAYTYDFPHTCPRNCISLQPDLCPHHTCRLDCAKSCVKFVCKECTAAQPPDADGTQLLLHAKVYEIADKYDVPTLRKLACEKFERACRIYWNDAQFLVAAAHALSTTPDNDKGLRDIICRVIIVHRQLLDNQDVEKLLNEHPQANFAVTKRLAAELNHIERETLRQLL
jgi:hypothetical protein